MSGERREAWGTPRTRPARINTRDNDSGPTRPPPTTNNDNNRRDGLSASTRALRAALEEGKDAEGVEYDDFVRSALGEMGYEEDVVENAIKSTDSSDVNHILNYILSLPVTPNPAADDFITTLLLHRADSSDLTEESEDPDPTELLTDLHASFHSASLINGVPKPGRRLSDAENEFKDFLLASLTEMGYGIDAAQSALEATSYEGVEQAVAHLESATPPGMPTRSAQFPPSRVIPAYMKRRRRPSQADQEAFARALRGESATTKSRDPTQRSSSALDTRRPDESERGGGRVRPATARTRDNTKSEEESVTVVANNKALRVNLGNTGGFGVQPPKPGEYAPSPALTSVDVNSPALTTLGGSGSELGSESDTSTYNSNNNNNNKSARKQSGVGVLSLADATKDDLPGSSGPPTGRKKKIPILDTLKRDKKPPLSAVGGSSNNPLNTSGLVCEEGGYDSLDTFDDFDAELLKVDDTDADLFASVGDTSSIRNIESKSLGESRAEFVDEEVGVYLFQGGVTFVENDRKVSFVSFDLAEDKREQVNEDSDAVFEMAISFEHIRNVDVIDSHIGKGGQGQVRKVVHEFSGLWYALKTLPLSNNAKHRKVVARELRNLYHCHSEYITKFKGACFEAGQVKILMEFMDGGSLRDLYQKIGSVPEPALRYIAERVLRALDYLHKQGVMHRDVKPENILSTLEGRVKLADLGISVASNNHLAMSVVGTNRYFSPERLSNSAEPYSFAADMWSFGITLTELGLGRFPYPIREDPEPLTEGEMGCPNPFDLCRQVQNSPSPWLPHDRYTQQCRDFLSICLAKDPNDRWMPAQLLEHPFILGEGAVVVYDQAAMGEFLCRSFPDKAKAMEADKLENPWRYNRQSLFESTERRALPLKEPPKAAAPKAKRKKVVHVKPQPAPVTVGRSPFFFTEMRARERREKTLARLALELHNGDDGPPNTSTTTVGSGQGERPDSARRVLGLEPSGSPAPQQTHSNAEPAVAESLDIDDVLDVLGDDYVFDYESKESKKGKEGSTVERAGSAPSLGDKRKSKKSRKKSGLGNGGDGSKKGGRRSSTVML